MTSITVAHRIFVLGTLALTVAAATAQSSPAKNTTQKDDAFVVQAQKAYATHLAAERSGDVSLYRQVRSKVAIQEMLDDLKKRGKSEKDLGAMLVSSAKFSTSLDGFRFLSAQGQGNAGRLLYRKDWKQGDQEMLDFLGYVVRLEDGQWKVDCVINATGTKIGVDNAGKLQERTVEEVSLHRCLSMK